MSNYYTRNLRNACVILKDSFSTDIFVMCYKSSIHKEKELSDNYHRMLHPTYPRVRIRKVR